MLKFSEYSRLIWGQKVSVVATTHYSRKVVRRRVNDYWSTSCHQSEWAYTHSHTRICQYKLEWFKSDPQTGVEQRRALLCNLRSEYRCSMCPAIHTISRILLRPSSTYEPSDPPLRIFSMFQFCQHTSVFVRRLFKLPVFTCVANECKLPNAEALSNPTVELSSQTCLPCIANVFASLVHSTS